MKLSKLAGATSEIWQIFIADSSSTTGAGLTGLVFNTAGLTCYYHRDTDTTATAVTLQTMTVGSYTTRGFKEIDATNMPGWYQLCPETAWLAAGAKSVCVHLKGATNMAPLPIEVQLMAVNPDSATAFMTSVASVVGAVGSVTGLTAADVGAIKTKTDFLPSVTAGAAGGVFIAGTNAATTITTALTTTFTGSLTGSAASVTGAVGSVTGAVGSVTGAVGSVTGAVGSVTGAVGSVTGNVGGNVVGSVASVTAGVTLAAGAVDAASLATAGKDAISANVWAASGRTLSNSQGIKKNAAKAGFMFPMTDSTNHNPATGLTVTATRSLDGAAFGACANAVTEVSAGWYKLDLAAADLNADTVALKFTATGGDQLNISIVTAS